MSSRLIGLLAVFCASVLWGTSGTLQTLLPPGREPLVVAAIRLAVGAVTLIGLALLAGDSRRAFGRLPLGPVIAAGVAIACYNLLFFVAVTHAGVGVGTAIAIGSAPVWVTLYEILWRRRLPSPLAATGQGVSIAGAVLLVAGPGGAAASAFGVALAAVAGASYAAYSLATGRVGGRVPPGTLAAATFTVAALTASPALVLMPLGWASAPQAWPVLLFLGTVTTGVAYALFTRGLARLATSTAVTLSLVEPLTAWVLAIFIVGEEVTLPRLLGAALVFAGLTLVTLATTRGSAPREP